MLSPLITVRHGRSLDALFRICLAIKHTDSCNRDTKEIDALLCLVDVPQRETAPELFPESQSCQRHAVVHCGAELHIRKPEQPEQDASNTGNG